MWLDSMSRIGLVNITTIIMANTLYLLSTFSYIINVIQRSTFIMRHALFLIKCYLTFDTIVLQTLIKGKSLLRRWWLHLQVHKLLGHLKRFGQCFGICYTWVGAVRSILIVYVILMITQYKHIIL